MHHKRPITAVAIAVVAVSALMIAVTPFGSGDLAGAGAARVRQRRHHAGDRGTHPGVVRARQLQRTAWRQRALCRHGRRARRGRLRPGVDPSGRAKHLPHHRRSGAAGDRVVVRDPSGSDPAHAGGPHGARAPERPRHRALDHLPRSHDAHLRAVPDFVPSEQRRPAAAGTGRTVAARRGFRLHRSRRHHRSPTHHH